MHSNYTKLSCLVPLRSAARIRLTLPFYVPTFATSSTTMEQLILRLGSLRKLCSSFYSSRFEAGKTTPSALVSGTETDEDKYRGSFDESMQCFIADAD
ncbi:hypothetical protein H920_11185 [Fukomys damarensis]|uniref:Uncharacterized protein n=1 Tax=Fukomys damarensis TaxID=885580 RepID=A0A091D5J8_FUKDA|nr:hypothetical protein H920_11185 [Fukomys damarensis]